MWTDLPATTHRCGNTEGPVAAVPYASSVAGRSWIVHLIGFPASGKLTIARALSEAASTGDAPFVVLDNHHVNNVIFPVLDLDGIKPVPAVVWDRTREIAAVLRRTIEELSPPQWSFIFTNVLTDDRARSERRQDPAPLQDLDRSLDDRRDPVGSVALLEQRRPGFRVDHRDLAVELLQVVVDDEPEGAHRPDRRGWHPVHTSAPGSWQAGRPGGGRGSGSS